MLELRFPAADHVSEVRIRNFDDPQLDGIAVSSAGVKVTVSKDGKTLTAKTNVTTAAGEKSENVLVFDRK